MDNGNPTKKDNGATTTAWQVVLTYDTEKHTLEMGGTVPTLDVYLFLLEMAHRKIEGKIKLAEMQASIGNPRPALPGELDNLLKWKR